MFSCQVFYQAVEKHLSPIEFILSNSKGGDGVCMLRCIPRHSTYFYVRFIPRVLRALHLKVFEQPGELRVFQYTSIVNRAMNSYIVNCIKAEFSKDAHIPGRMPCSF